MVERIKEDISNSERSERIRRDYNRNREYKTRLEHIQYEVDTDFSLSPYSYFYK